MSHPLASEAQRLDVPFLLFLLLGIAFWCFRPGLDGTFLLDDHANLPQTALSSLDWGEIKSKVLWGSSAGAFSRSVSNLSFGLTQYFSGYHPYSIKYQNLLIHLLNGVLVFWLTSLLFSTPKGNDPARANWIALAVTSVWLLHPLHVSTVLYAVQRLVLLSTLFTLSALICYVKGRILTRTQASKGAVLALGGFAFFAPLALMSKENAALLPIYIVLIELFFFSRCFGTAYEKRAVYLLLTILVLLPVAAGIVYGLVQFADFTVGYAHREFTLGERLLTQIHVIALYLKLYFFPVPTWMSLFHDNFPVRRTIDVSTALLGLTYVGLLSLGIALRERQPAIGFGILWFFSCHLIESTFLPLELAFEHRNYLAILGPSIVVVLLVLRLLRSDNLKHLAVPVLFGLAILLGLNTAARAFVWGNTELMYRTQYQIRPDSPRVLSGMTYYELKRGNREGVNRYIEELKALGRPNAAAHLLHLSLHCNSTDIPNDILEQVEHLLGEGTITAFTVNSLIVLSNLQATRRCPALTSAQLLQLTKAANQNPSIVNNDYHCSIGHIHTKLLLWDDRWDEANAVFTAALEHCAQLAPNKIRLVIDSLINLAETRGRVSEIVELINGATRSHGALLQEIYGGQRLSMREPDDKKQSPAPSTQNSD